MLMDYERIKAEFLRMVGLSADKFRERALIERGTEEIVSRLKKAVSEMSEEEVRLCEYGAAACAAFTYGSEKCMRAVPVMSENGTVNMREGSFEAAKAAFEAKRQAVGVLCRRGLLDSGDFFFTAV